MICAMNKKFIKYIFIAILLLICGWYFFYTKPAPETKVKPEPSSAPKQTSLPPIKSSQSMDRSEMPSNEKRAEAVVYHPKDIEEIKKQIYDLVIEDVDDIPLLDSVVQTGDAPTRDFWQGDWASVDDNKADINGFYLRPQEDGTFVFFPDENTTRTYTFFETPKTYTYDPVKREFYWEMDYYGKTISHRARFINDKVLAMMLISGRKVTLDLYVKGPTENK
jgi:hypothetical protein